MSLLDRYVFFEWLKVFVLTLLLIVGIQLLGDFQNNLGDLLGFGATPAQIFDYYLTVLPSFLPAILPISLMVSLLFSLGQMHRHNEITAMLAGGKSLLRLTRTLWLAGAALSALLFYFNAQLVPVAVEQSRTQWNNLRFAAELAQDVQVEDVGLIYNLTFFNHRDNRLWFINRFNEFNYRAYGITVSEISDNGVEQRRLVANEGFFDDRTGHWVFQRGRELLFTEAGDLRRSIAFEERVLDAFHEDPDLMKFMERRPKDLSFLELRRILSTIGMDENPRVRAYAVQYYFIITSPLSCLLIVAIAIPFAVSGVRTNPMVGISKSIGLFVLYYIAVAMGQMLGTRAVLPPAVAALLPNLLMFMIALRLAFRMSRPQ